MTCKTDFTSIDLYSSEEKQQALQLITNFISFLQNQIHIENVDIFIQIITEFASQDLISITFEDFIFIGADLIAFLPFETKPEKRSEQKTINLSNNEKSNKTTNSIALVCLFLDYFQERVETRHIQELKHLFRSFCDGTADQELAKFIEKKSYVMSIIPSPKNYH